MNAYSSPFAHDCGPRRPRVGPARTIVVALALVAAALVALPTSDAAFTAAAENPGNVLGVLGVQRLVAAGIDTYGARARLPANPPATSAFLDAIPPSEIDGTPIVDVDSAGTRSCAVGTSDLWCWGRSSDGALGVAPYDVDAAAPHPRRVGTFGAGEATPAPSGLRYTSIALAPGHSCATTNLASPYAVYCWGANDVGQLGRGSMSPTPGTIPQPVAGLPASRTALAVAVGGSTSCALLDNASVYCWGAGGDGQIGAGDTVDTATPLQVQWMSGMPEPTAIAVGARHSCAIASAQVWCWGSNVVGQLGISNSGTAAILVGYPSDMSMIPAPRGLSSLTAGDDHTCVLSNGRPYCWGAGSSGQIGHGSNPTAQHTMVVPGGYSHGVTSIAAGADTTCAVVSGAVECWGNNGRGQFGYDGVPATNAPMSAMTGALLDASLERLVLGDGTACMVSGDAKAICWGDDSHSQVGSGALEPSPAPAQWRAGTYVWGTDMIDQRTITAISAGFGYSCLLADGYPYCWGRNHEGQLGNGSKGSWTPVPTRVENRFGGQSRLDSIDSSENHTCGLAAGQAYCWGNNDFGELGNGTVESSARPVAVQFADGVSRSFSAVAAGFAFSCGLAGGRIYCWGGAQYSGQTGTDGLETQAVPVPGDAEFTNATFLELSAGVLHSCALTDGGAAFCWGLMSWPNPGAPGGYSFDRLAPTRWLGGLVNTSTVLTRISAGFDNTCAVAGSDVVCWGDNLYGALGNGTTEFSNEPTRVEFPLGFDASTVTALDIFEDSVCAIAGGQLWCWGENSRGQLGNGFSTNRHYPTLISTLPGPVLAISVGGAATLALVSA